MDGLLYEMATIVSKATIAMLIGTASANAPVPARAIHHQISCVAYVVDDKASEAKTARPNWLCPWFGAARARAQWMAQQPGAPRTVADGLKVETEKPWTCCFYNHRCPFLESRQVDGSVLCSFQIKKPLMRKRG